MEDLKKRWHFYLAALLFILGLFFYGRGYATENPHAIRHIQMYYCKVLVYENCKTVAQKSVFHKENRTCSLAGSPPSEGIVMNNKKRKLFYIQIKNSWRLARVDMSQPIVLTTTVHHNFNHNHRHPLSEIHMDFSDRDSIVKYGVRCEEMQANPFYF